MVFENKAKLDNMRNTQDNIPLTISISAKVVVSGGGDFNLIYDGQTNKGSYTVVPVNIDTSESIATQISQGYLRIKPNCKMEYILLMYYC